MDYTIRSEEVSVTIASRGGELRSIRDRSGVEYLWQGDGRYWSDRSPHLFPYVGRLWEGKYRFEGREYELGIHGFLRHRELAAHRRGEDSIVFTCYSDEETLAQYPFAFGFHVAYTLSANRLEIRYIVENRGGKTMYFGLGGHPGFNLPLEEGFVFSEYSLTFDEACSPVRVGFGKTALRNGVNAPFPLELGSVLPLSHDLFDDEAVVLANVSRGVTLGAGEGRRALRLEYPQMPYLGLWHPPHTEAPFACLEPWATQPGREGRIEDLSEQEDLLSLEAAERYSNSWYIEII